MLHIKLKQVSSQFVDRFGCFPVMIHCIMLGNLHANLTNFVFYNDVQLNVG